MYVSSMVRQMRIVGTCYFIVVVLIGYSRMLLLCVGCSTLGHGRCQSTLSIGSLRKLWVRERWCKNGSFNFCVGYFEIL